MRLLMYLHSKLQITDVSEEIVDSINIEEYTEHSKYGTNKGNGKKLRWSQQVPLKIGKYLTYYTASHSRSH
jgi:hypothetical protein